MCLVKNFLKLSESDIVWLHIHNPKLELMFDC